MHLDGLNILAIINVQTKSPSDALELIDRVLEINPNSAGAYVIRGVALFDLEFYHEAVASFDIAVGFNPLYVEAWVNRGNSLLALKRFEDALDSYDRAITVDPVCAEAHYNRSATLLQMRRIADALSSADQAIAIAPNYAEAYLNRAVALIDLGRLDEAVLSCDKAIAINSAYAEAHYNRGVALNELNRQTEAVDSFDYAISLKQNYVEATLNKSIVLLRNGNFDAGWLLYESRWEQSGAAKFMRSFSQPLWLGSEEIDGKTILLHAEQGFGDTIQFCRYSKLVKDLGARVLLEVPAMLTGLLGELEGVDLLLTRGAPLPKFDFHCPVMSLPLAFKTKLETIPNSGPYLSASSNKSSEWYKRLGERSIPRVGLVWSGSARNTNDHNRSLSLKSLLPYLPINFEYFCLQKEIRASDAIDLAGSMVKCFSNHIHDFTDAAALCDLMDIIISVDTSLAHLSGALGKNTLVLLPFSPHWPWMLDREDSLWYDTVKLIRQGPDCQWERVLKKMNIEIKKYI